MVRGRKIKKTKGTTTRGDAVAGYTTPGILIRPKHPKRLGRGWRGGITAKIKVAATDEFGQTATAKLEETLVPWWTFLGPE